MNPEGVQGEYNDSVNTIPVVYLCNEHAGETVISLLGHIPREPPQVGWGPGEGPTLDHFFKGWTLFWSRFSTGIGSKMRHGPAGGPGRGPHSIILESARARTRGTLKAHLDAPRGWVPL